MITKEMVLGEIIRTSPNAIDILGESGMHCLGKRYIKIYK